MTAKILGVASSMRDNSYSTKTLKKTLEYAKLKGAETRLLDLSKTILPLYSPANESPKEIKKVREDVLWADTFILASPDYHGSMSGSMKNFLDYFWSEFAGKTFGYICASHEKGLTAMEQMRTAARQCYGWSLPYGVSVNSDDDFDTEGNITNPKIRSRLEMMARDLAVYGEIIHKQFMSDLVGANPDTFAARHRSR